MKKKLFVILTSLILISSLTGCAKEEAPPTPPPADNTQSGQLPAGHPPTGGNQGGGTTEPAKPINTDEVVENINKAIDQQFPGDWSASGKTLKKGDYTENENFKIADAVIKEYPGSMVSIFVGQDRVSTTVFNNSTKERVLEGYPTPAEVGQVMESGKVMTTQNNTMGSYQKVYMPLKSGDKTVAVLTISISN